MRISLRILGVGAAVAVALAILGEVSPWPSALMIRFAFDLDSQRVNRTLAAQVPAGVSAALDQSYGPLDPDARLDVFFPDAAERRGRRLLTVVWVHGGGWISGRKEYIANYARILAAGGVTVVGVNYSVAPEHTYPTALRQVNASLTYLEQHAAQLHVDPDRFVLAGDSAGANIAAELANAITSPEYARAIDLLPALKAPQLAGVLLYCGPYELRSAQGSGMRRWFSGTVMWSYGGIRDLGDPRLAPISVLHYVTPRFPPAFISAGNADPLFGQSEALAAKLAGLGVSVTTLFFAPGYVPAQPHEYQFRLDTAEGQRALKASLAFLAARQAAPAATSERQGP